MGESCGAASGAVEFPLRLAAMDIGSNAIRFVAAEFTSASHSTPLRMERVPVRLGHSAFLTRYLEEELIDEAVRALRGFRRRMDELEVVEHRAVATSAVRESRNGAELIERGWEEAGIRIDPITGAEEGRLVWRAITGRIALGERRWILADLGGGSVEVTLVEGGQLLWTESLPLGTVRLLEKLGPEPSGALTPLAGLIEESTRSLAQSLAGVRDASALVATGGNAEALADLAGAPADARGVRRLSRAALRGTAARLAGLSYAERMRELGLRADRADVILPAAFVYERIAELAGQEMILVPGVGLKEGVLLDLVEDLTAHRTYEERLAEEVEEGALALGRRYAFDEAHARHVAGAALRLFDELRPLHELEDGDRRVLLAAALLHDIGLHLAYQKHHKHSRYLILHSPPRGLTPHEVELVSLVARYHRRATPRDSHEGYGDLSGQDRRRVRRLAALLRIADALDHEHRQQVTLAQVRRERGAVTLALRAGAEDAYQDWVLRKKSELFEEEFDSRLQVTIERDLRR